MLMSMYWERKEKLNLCVSKSLSRWRGGAISYVRGVFLSFFLIILRTNVGRINGSCHIRLVEPRMGPDGPESTINFGVWVKGFEEERPK